jgi:hypothetical protein
MFLSVFADELQGQKPCTCSFVEDFLRNQNINQTTIDRILTVYLIAPSFFRRSRPLCWCVQIKNYT